MDAHSLERNKSIKDTQDEKEMRLRKCSAIHVPLVSHAAFSKLQVGVRGNENRKLQALTYPLSLFLSIILPCVQLRTVERHVSRFFKGETLGSGILKRNRCS